ncbi:hypothetical protein QR90_03360 [Deinococcus radiopugnans]|uniref:Uncharacterized protein n=2 Tax=Deinococcus radiopugnans TaxID=57497 RepID=A0A0A7KDY7_9DEIO|nr:hypothetical protein [Deinococcus radiopugnans]AIZ44346.1 hypothetical protein QR90_03360 [Deinococcus radiopugnans]MBB6017532.1 hypothetical protein [Deinococcus radiopugnans ATCC 19172]QLG09934.1 hypothetical protein HLB42_03485 [Deinococcus sp. D7000]TNM69786.1 hypothetical protein FHR04_14495 [Deinococcus radiopugnans ATCC 19172]
MPRRRPVRSAAEPIRATSMWRVDQVFLARKGMRVEVTSSLVNDHGGLRNLSVTAPTDDPLEAVRHAARFIAGKGNVSGARQARVRWTREQATTEQDALIRDRLLEDEFLDEFEETLAAVRDQQR